MKFTKTLAVVAMTAAMAVGSALAAGAAVHSGQHPEMRRHCKRTLREPQGEPR